MADILHVFPGVQLRDVKRMSWGELRRWRAKAVEIYRTTRGLNG